MFSSYSSPLPSLACQQVNALGQQLIVSLTSIATQAHCPLCGHSSQRIHSRYSRRLTDLPVAGQTCIWQIKACKFFCDNADCHRRIFTQRFTDHIRPYARWLNRCQLQLEQIGLLAGGSLGSSMAKLFGLLVSGTTLLRRVRQKSITVANTPRVLGVDDWAFRKGKNYGTILVDLEKKCVIDLLPDRESQTLKQWLDEHPGVEVISRDRAGAYALAATQGAPQAIQVADRWHLLKNLGETMQRVLETQRSAMKQASDSVTQAISPPPTPPVPVQIPIDTAPMTHRGERFQQVKAYQHAGRSKRWIAQETGLSRNTVGKYWSWSTYQAKTTTRYSPIRRYEAYGTGHPAASPLGGRSTEYKNTAPRIATTRLSGSLSQSLSFC